MDTICNEQMISTWHVINGKQNSIVITGLRINIELRRFILNTDQLSDLNTGLGNNIFSVY